MHKSYISLFPRPFNYPVFNCLRMQKLDSGKTCMEATVITYLSSLFYPQFCNSFLPLHLLPGCHAILLGLLQGVELRYFINKGQYCEWNCFLIITFFAQKIACTPTYIFLHYLSRLIPIGSTHCLVFDCLFVRMDGQY